MLILALDTTTRTGSVALARDGALVDCHIGDPDHTHGERLPGDVLSLLERHGLTTREVGLYAVCVGPGSFTGLRVGLATIQGLALGHGQRVVAISALEALAYAALWADTKTDRPDCLGAWMNAHRGEIFAALYPSPSAAASATDAEACPVLTPIVEPMAAEPQAILRRWRPELTGRTVRVAGDAVAGSRAIMVDQLSTPARIDLVEDTPPLAPILARLAATRANSAAAQSPHAVQPVYVRRPDAELARERRRSSRSR